MTPQASLRKRLEVVAAAGTSVAFPSQTVYFGVAGPSEAVPR